MKSYSYIVKNKINLFYNNRLQNIILSTRLFINNINKFNYEYIKQRINKDNIFEKYTFHKLNFITSFFDTFSNNINENDIYFSSNESFLNEINYNNIFNTIANNYSDFVSNLINEIDENFTKYKCIEDINNGTYSDTTFESDLFLSDEENIQKCIKEKYSSELNYSKYNFNVVKFRTEISNCRKFLEMFNRLFDGLNYKNIIDINDIIQIDNSINHKNILYIYNKTYYSSKSIKQEFLSIVNETFDDLYKDFINKNDLTKNYKEYFNLFQNILNYENLNYNNNISEKINKTLNYIEILLIDFNSTLFNNISDIINNTKYDYYSINYNNYKSIYNNYFYLINDSFSNYLSKIKELKTNNKFYSTPIIILDEIFDERRKKIEEIIKNHSQNYNFDSIGFKYELNKEFDLFVKNYYTNFEFNKSYEYFELFENSKSIYIDKLTNTISSVKNIIENKFNLIFDYFMEYLKNGANYVENDFIENIKLNKSKCLNMIYDLELNISLELNDTNITLSKDYIENNCSIGIIFNSLLHNLTDDICLNISGINFTLYLYEYDFLFEDCKNNNYYNYSFIIFEKIDDKNKIHCGGVVSNITQIISLNFINENYLFNYIRENYYNNSDFDLNIDEYSVYFEDFEDLNFYINNFREPEYKNIMSNILIKSFNESYTNIANLFLTNELINKINLLINDKLDILINYYSEKLKNDYEYYELLLENIEQLGNSSKCSIINLFSNIPEKIKEYFYYMVEDEIFYYIDLFFRENKNIFISNFIEFYINKENHYNLSIYNIEEYIYEIIADKNFNKSLNDISSYLMTEIKNKIKENIKNSILDKINSLNEQCNNINNNIQIKLNKIKTSELPEEMENLVELINNYTNLVENQNNRYIFIVGESPFNLLNNFIQEELEPPLLLILEKYNNIEEELLNRTKAIAEDFPDCYSEIKTNLLGTKINFTEHYINQINFNLYNYQNILTNDIETYINKLIHFTYINGLQTTDESCENSEDCDIQEGSLRNLNDKKILNITNTYKGKPLIIKKSDIKDKINKEVIFGLKRRISSIYEYTSDMGALSENNIIYYLTDLQNSILKLNKSFFGKEYLNVNLTKAKFLTKINYTYLAKLRQTFDIKLIKFSTILTEKSIQKLKDIILSQFYLIEKFVHQSSDLVEFKVNYFLNELNKTSEFLECLSGYIHNQVLGYHKILHTMIQNKYRSFNEKEFTKDDLMGESVNSRYLNNKTKKTVMEVVGVFHSNVEYDIDYLQIISNIFHSNSNFNFLDKIKNYTKIGKTFSKTFSIPFTAFPYFQIMFNISAYAGLGLGVSFEYSRSEHEVYLVLDVFGEAKLPMQIEGGIYIPASKSKFQIAMAVGLDGIIGHGRAGIKLEISLKNLNTDCDAYFIFNALVFQFYFQIRIIIDIPLYHFTYEFDVIRLELFGIHTELHTLKKAKQEAFKKNGFGGFEFNGADFISPKPEGKDIIVK